MNDEHHGPEHMHHHKGILSNPWVGKLGAVFLVFAIIFMAAKAVNAVVNFDTLSQPPSNVITVNGEGKVSASPDIATVSFTVSEDADTATHAQDAATKKVNVALAVLKDLKIADKDVKTSSYNVSPRYSYQPPCYTYPCPYNGDQKIIGFTAAQTVEVKVRDIDSVGKVLTSLGDAGVSNIYGPNFTIEDPDGVKAQARKEAIDKARAQAQTLAKDLGVRLVRVVNFSEGGGGYPTMYFKSADSMGMGGTAPAQATPAVPAGENEIVVDVSVTYEIR